MKRAIAAALIAAACPVAAQAQHGGHGDHAAAPPAAPSAMPPDHQHPATPPGDAAAHAGHGAADPASPMPAMATPVPPSAQTSPDHAADSIFGADAMAASRSALISGHGGGIRSLLSVDRLEWADGGGQGGYAWDAGLWVGGDIDRLHLRSEGEGGSGNGPESVETQLLWSRAVHPFWDVEAGIRQDFTHGPDRTHAVLGMRGLAPWWVHVSGTLFLSTHGELTAKVEAEHDMRLTRRLILQPRGEAQFSAQSVPELALGSGVTSVEAGLRLRYVVVPEFAPYAGVAFTRSLGGTADYIRARGEDSGGWKWLVGLRFWF